MMEEILKSLTFVSEAVPYSSVPQIYKMLYCRRRQNLERKTLD